nr:hypothetical protein [Nocardiopsis potens]
MTVPPVGGRLADAALPVLVDGVRLADGVRPPADRVPRPGAVRPLLPGGRPARQAGHQLGDGLHEPLDAGFGIAVVEPAVLAALQGGDVLGERPRGQPPGAADEHRDHGDPVGEGLGDLPARPVVRVVQRPAALPAGGVQPARADDREEQVAAVYGAQQGPLEVLSRADRLAGAEDLVRPESGGELAFDQCRARLLITGAIIDENAVQTVFSSSVVSGGGRGVVPEER